MSMDSYNIATIQHIRGFRSCALATGPSMADGDRVRISRNTLEGRQRRRRPVYDMEFIACKPPAAALRTSEKIYHSLFSGMPNGVALCEILYDKWGQANDYRILHVNPAYEAIFEVTREEEVGNKASELQRTSCLSHLETCARVVATGEPATFGATFGWTRRTFRITALATGHGRFAMVFEDITERKGFEQRFYQAQKMEEIGRLVGGVAHDFNNLLTAIIGYSELVLDRVRDQSDVAVDVEEIKKAGERASQLTRQLLAFSRTRLLEPQVLDLNQVVGGFEKMLRRVISEDIHFDIVAAPSLGCTKADPSQVEQLLLNLVVNAHDAMPQGGTLTIATANVVLDSEFARRHVGAVPGRYVSLTVQDTGCGMTPDVLGRVFEPFFTTKGPGRGTGLGLSTVSELVKQSGGYITVESTPGVGTTVTTYSPMVDSLVESAAAGLRSTLTIEGTETILLVEDEAGVRNLMQRVLERYGYAVLEAQNVDEAIAIAEGHRGPIHLLVSDMVMPGLSGPDLAQRVVGRRPATKVLFLSGYAHGEALDLRVSSQNARFLPKPFTPETLAMKVRESLDLQVGQAGAM